MQTTNNFKALRKVSAHVDSANRDSAATGERTGRINMREIALGSVQKQPANNNSILVDLPTLSSSDKTTEEILPQVSQKLNQLSQSKQ